MSMDVKLVVVGGNAKPAEIKLNLPVVIGRGRRATLVIPHPLVSRVHCEIYEENGRLGVRDLDSLNGTYVNRQRVTEAALPSGGLLTLGDITFRAVYGTEQASEADQPGAQDVSQPASDDLQIAEDHDHRESVALFGEDQAEDPEARTEAADVDPEELAQQIRKSNEQP